MSEITAQEAKDAADNAKAHEDNIYNETMDAITTASDLGEYTLVYPETPNSTVETNLDNRFIAKGYTIVPADNQANPPTPKLIDWSNPQ